MNLDQFEGHTPGPWVKADRMNGPWWGISSRHSVDGRFCESGRQSIANVHGAHSRSGYAAMFEANARLIAAAPELLAEVRRLTAELARAREVLQDVEWVFVGKRTVCPACGKSVYAGHAPDCALSAALAAK